MPALAGFLAHDFVPYLAKAFIRIQVSRSMLGKSYRAKPVQEPLRQLQDEVAPGKLQERRQGRHESRPAEACPRKRAHGRVPMEACPQKPSKDVPMEACPQIVLFDFAMKQFMGTLLRAHPLGASAGTLPHAQFHGHASMGTIPRADFCGLAFTGTLPWRRRGRYK